jgi:hypothetical protein
MNSPTILTTLVLCGLLGAVGQGIRAAVGLKSAATLQAQSPGQQSQFDAAYLMLSLMIGFIAGVLAGIVILLDSQSPTDQISPKTLLAIIAAGYAGTDFIENVFTNLLPKLGSPPTTLLSAKDSQEASAKATEKPDVQTASKVPAAQTPDVIGLSAKVETMSSQVADIHGTLTHLLTSGDGGVPETNYPAWALTRDVKIARSKYWDDIVDGAGTYGLPIAVILAIGSKESQWGLALKPPGPAGTGDFAPRNPAKWGTAMPTDDKGWGRGLMQIDWFSNDFAKTGDWQDPRANILYGCELLAQKIKKFTDAGRDEDTAMRCGVSAYNGMSGATSSYANDVMARAAWIHAQGLDVTAQELAVA